MNTHTNSQGSRRFLEGIKWLVITILLVVVIVGNYYYSDAHLLLRTLAIMLILIIAGGIAMITNKGKSAVVFAREARTELRKVIWPTRQETFHTTLIVAVMTAIMSLVLWGLDGILVYVVSFVTSLRF